MRNASQLFSNLIAVKYQILAYFGASHASHIHARGQISTQKLVELLDAQDGERILEIGFGTGATLVQVAATSSARLTGYELSSIMHATATKRVQFCQVSDRVELTLLENKNQFPTADNTFDKVYVESMIAIQEGNDFFNLLQEIKRVLKPQGMLLFNETIWLDSTSRATALEINSACKTAFGIIQANDEYTHVKDWKKVLQDLGFNHDLDLSVSAVSAGRQRRSAAMLRSTLFTRMGKLKAAFSPSMRSYWKNFERQMDAILDGKGRVMDGVIMKWQKGE